MKKIAFLATLAALFACTKTPQEQPLPTKGNYSGTVSVDWNGGTFDTENISVDYLPAADGMTADIIIYKIKIVPAMPVTIDVTIPGGHRHAQGRRDCPERKRHHSHGHGRRTV